MSKGRPWACIITCILTVISAIIILIAASIYTNRSYYLRDYWGILFGFSICTIVVASMAIIVAIGLAYVAFRRFPALTTLFSGLLVLVALFSAICGVAFILSRSYLPSKSISETTRLVKYYRGSAQYSSTKSIIDRVQQTYECCGIDQALDWASTFPDGKSTPDSCCKIVTPGCGNGSLLSQTSIYIRGCVEPVESHYKQRYTILIGMHFNLILFAVVSATLGLIYERYIRDQYQLM
ncbi:hypothetical protein I4U23_017557 [Adineta vaga]|nr:hypothetical protein I4U23_017557 [Adineta vaga]